VAWRRVAIEIGIMVFIIFVPGLDVAFMSYQRQVN
jgi:hypothetical protein